jgi:hypothetical protein
MAASLPSKDGLLLQWLSNSREWLNRLWIYGETQNIICEVFIPVYGPSIECPSLRYALLAFASAMNEDDNREADNADDAGRALCIKSPDTISEGDLFASVFLAFASIPTRRDRVQVHLHGFLAILKLLSQRSTSSLSIFWPLARDMLLWAMSDQNGVSNEMYLKFLCECRILLGPSTWRQRRAYFTDTYTAIRRSLYFHRRILKCAVRMLPTIGSSFSDVVKLVLADGIEHLGEIGKLPEVQTKEMKGCASDGPLQIKEASQNMGSWVRYHLAQGIFRVLLFLYDAGGIVKGFRSEAVLQETKSMFDVVISWTSKIRYGDMGPFPDRVILAETIALWGLAWPRDNLPDLFEDKGARPRS